VAAEGGVLSRKEKNRDEPVQVIIHLYMEMSQWSSLYNYLKQTKMPFSKTKNRKVKQVPSGG
jgi:hypothetical protein